MKRSISSVFAGVALMASAQVLSDDVKPDPLVVPDSDAVTEEKRKPEVFLELYLNNNRNTDIDNTDNGCKPLMEGVKLEICPFFPPDDI